MRILHRKIGRYSGAVIYGDEVVPPPDGDAATYHAQRAFWLTGEVETGNRLGSVMMADGTAFTIGIDQHVAVYPRELADEDFNAADDQGAAFDLLAKLEVTDTQYVSDLWGAFGEEGWYVGLDGRLRHLDAGVVKVKGRNVEVKAGDLVHGALIRNAVTPKGGIVKKDTNEWEVCRRWAMLLHRLVSDPKTLDVQRAFGIYHLGHRVAHRKLRLAGRRRKPTFQKRIYSGSPVTGIRSSDLEPALDLALCVFHSYTVNAPSVAFRLLEASVEATGFAGHLGATAEQQRTFADDLLFRIRTKRYGRWGNRWERTRKHALGVGWWPRALFIGNQAVMAK